MDIRAVCYGTCGTMGPEARTITNICTTDMSTTTNLAVVSIRTDLTTLAGGQWYALRHAGSIAA